MGDTILEQLRSLRDASYGNFQAKLIPTVAPDRIIGVRTPALRQLAKQLRGTAEAELFISQLPHTWFDENQLHAFIIAGLKPFETCIDAVERFLPHIDNWATCDQLSPAIFKKHHKDLIPYIDRWLNSRHEYTVRFAIGTLLAHFLDNDFNTCYPARVTAIHSDSYYIRMMQAWYFATALAKQWEAALPYLTEGRLDPWVHRKTIQKAIESYRITDERKDLLKSLCRKDWNHHNR